MVKIHSLLPLPLHVSNISPSAYCFYRPAMGEDCQRECGPSAPPTAQQCPKKTGSYDVDEGWLLIDGNKCDAKSPLSAKPKGKVSCSMYIYTSIPSIPIVVFTPSPRLCSC